MNVPPDAFSVICLSVPLQSFCDPIECCRASPCSELVGPRTAGPRNNRIGGVDF
jgi:hypothetical protein